MGRAFSKGTAERRKKVKSFCSDRGPAVPVSSSLPHLTDLHRTSKQSQQPQSFNCSRQVRQRSNLFDSSPVAGGRSPSSIY